MPSCDYHYENDGKCNAPAVQAPPGREPMCQYHYDHVMANDHPNLHSSPFSTGSTTQRRAVMVARDSFAVAQCSFELGLLSGQLLKDGAEILKVSVQDSSVIYKRAQTQYSLVLRQVST